MLSFYFLLSRTQREDGTPQDLLNTLYTFVEGISILGLSQGKISKLY